MEQLLYIRDTIKGFFGRYDGYIRSVLRFLLCLIVLLSINSSLGYMERLKSMPIVLIISLLCSFLPANIIVFFAALFVAAHSYGVSLESAVIVTVLFFLMFLLYYRYSPKDTLAVLLTPLCFVFKVPYLIPLVFGLVGTPLSAISVSCGVVAYYVIGYLSSNYTVITGMTAENTVMRFRFILDGMLRNREMMVMIIGFSVTVIVVNVIKRFYFKFAWPVAIFAGTLTDILVIAIAASKTGAKISGGALVAGSLFSMLIAVIVKFFIFTVDYEKTERVQFEDDDYYYYVKAVPKIKSRGYKGTK
ncbi:MAG: hypothetical protein IK139_01965 [Lachnospiraceae bacterium]|nr:hypothetical protein [Lachnospiraceae bacterium]